MKQPFKRSLELLLISTASLGAWSIHQSGVAIDRVYEPIRDDQNRPVTAGHFVPRGPVYFMDISEQTGISAFRHVSGTNKKFILEAPSGGVALIDFDRDGFLDIYFVNGSTLEALNGSSAHPQAALFRNQGDGTFEDVTLKAGVENRAWGFGVSSGDFNNDGWPDMFVTNFGSTRLFKNNGNGTFTDIADKAGVNIQEWVTASTFGDFNRDGHLDLFVCGYLDFDLDVPPVPGSPQVGHSFCEYRGQPVMCGPRGLPGTRDFLFLNNGDGTFSEVSEKAGVADEAGYYGFAAAWIDVDDDGWLDLVVANDSTPNYLYRNNGDGTFEDISYPSAFALNSNGREQAGMGIAVGDYNNDLRPDIYLTHFSDDYNTLYHNDGNGFFMDLTYQVGLGQETIPFLGWGTSFLDVDNNGLLDILVANGHVYVEVDDHNWGTTWAQRPQLFLNQEGKRFQPAPAVQGTGLGLVIPARGLAAGDLDNDGKVDAVVNCIGEQPRVLQNRSADKNHWVSLSLQGTGSVPRDGIGSKVFLTTARGTQRRDVISGGSFASHSDLRVHFGVGPATSIEQIEIVWPDGTRQTILDAEVDRILHVTKQEP